MLSKFHLFTNLCTSVLSYKTILKFTLKQIRRVSVLQLHHHRGGHSFVLTKVTVVKVVH